MPLRPPGRDCHQQVARRPAARWPAVSLPIGDTMVTSAIAFAAPRLHQIDDGERRERWQNHDRTIAVAAGSCILPGG
jgi:hypothetical protein